MLKNKTSLKLLAALRTRAETAKAVGTYGKLKQDLMFDETFIKFFEKTMVLLGVPRTAYSKATVSDEGSVKGSEEIQLTGIKSPLDFNLFSLCSKLHAMEVRGHYDVMVEVNKDMLTMTVTAQDKIWDAL